MYYNKCFYITSYFLLSNAADVTHQINSYTNKGVFIYKKVRKQVLMKSFRTNNGPLWDKKIGTVHAFIVPSANWHHFPE